MSKGSLKSVGAVLLDHPQRGAPGIDIVQMEQVVSLLADRPAWYQIHALGPPLGPRATMTRRGKASTSAIDAERPAPKRSLQSMVLTNRHLLVRTELVLTAAQAPSSSRPNSAAPFCVPILQPTQVCG